MNGQISRTASDKPDTSRIVGNTALVAAVAVIILMPGVFPANAANDQPAAKAGSRQVVIDCKETDKKVKLAPNEGSITFAFQNCTCWRDKFFFDQYFDWVVNGTIGKANDDKYPGIPIIIRADLLPISTETLTVPIGKTETIEFYCYPKSSMDKLHDWSDSLLKSGNQ